MMSHLISFFFAFFSSFDFGSWSNRIDEMRNETHVKAKWNQYSWFASSVRIIVSMTTMTLHRFPYFFRSFSFTSSFASFLFSLCVRFTLFSSHQRLSRFIFCSFRLFFFQQQRQRKLWTRTNSLLLFFSVSVDAKRAKRRKIIKSRWKMKRKWQWKKHKLKRVHFEMNQFLWFNGACICQTPSKLTDSATKLNGNKVKSEQKKEREMIAVYRDAHWKVFFISSSFVTIESKCLSRCRFYFAIHKNWNGMRIHTHNSKSIECNRIFLLPRSYK